MPPRIRTLQSTRFWDQNCSLSETVGDSLEVVGLHHVASPPNCELMILPVTFGLCLVQAPQVASAGIRHGNNNPSVSNGFTGDISTCQLSQPTLCDHVS